MADRPSFVFHPSVVSTIKFKSYQLVRARSDHTWADIPDIKQAMFLHLIIKQDQFDPARGSEGTFASTVIDHWIAQYLRDRGRIKRGGTHHTTPFSQLGSKTQTQGVSFDDQLSSRDGDRRRWRHTGNFTEPVDREDALKLALSLLSDFQRRLLEDVSKHSVSYAARQREVSRRQIVNEIESIRKIFIKCGLNSHSLYNR